MNTAPSQLFSFICNPAAIMHPDWRVHLPAWGVPEALCDSLWDNRNENGKLSRFLAERFQLCLDRLVDIHNPYQQLLFIEGKNLETGLVHLGSVFLHKQAIHILDGARLREIKKEFGEKHFHFMRHQAEDFIKEQPDQPDHDHTEHNSQSETEQIISKRQALLLGLAAFLEVLPSSSDLIMRLYLKLPPLADEPRSPEGFALIQKQIETNTRLLQAHALEKIFEKEAA